MIVKQMLLSLSKLYGRKASPLFTMGHFLPETGSKKWQKLHKSCSHDCGMLQTIVFPQFCFDA